jgi:heme oxygenase
MHSIRSRLRAATRNAHARVDARFAGGLVSVAAYHAYLLGMDALLRACDAALQRTPPGGAWQPWSNDERRRHLGADLAALGLHPAIAAPGMVLASRGEAIGALYVIEGSALGARQLQQDATRLGFDGDRGAAFLSHHAGGPARWPRFVAQLDALPASLAPALEAGALAGGDAARDAFQTSGDCR